MLCCGDVRVGELYAQDSLFTLGWPARIGLILLSVTLTLAVLRAAWALAGIVPFFFPVPIITVGLFWLFVWLSPQVYYLYYQMIFDGLPWQIVIKWPPPGLQDLGALAGFSGPRTLSAHGQGVLIWLILGVSAAASIRRQKFHRSR